MKDLENAEMIEISGGGEKKRTSFDAAISAIGGAVGGAAGFIISLFN